MKMKCLALSVVMALGVAQTAAAAEFLSNGTYLRGDIGGSELDWSGGNDDGALTGGVGLGYDFGNGVRVDGRLDLTRQYHSDEDFGSTTLLGNLYYDFPVSDVASPYLGAGIGWGWLGDGKTGDENGMAWSLMGGLNMSVTDSVTGDVGYRFRQIELDGADVSDHSILAGLRYAF